MIDTLGMVLCISGFALLSFGNQRWGFTISAAGSLFWLLFGIAVSSNALIIQSVAYLALSTYAALRHELASKDAAKPNSRSRG
jgi:hypothetical protein